MVLLVLLPACKLAVAVPAERSWPAVSGPVRLGDGGVRTIRVAPAVARTEDPRFHGDPARYAASDEPWSWTEDQRIAAAARDLADLLGRMTCGDRAEHAEAPPTGARSGSDPSPESGSPAGSGAGSEGTVDCPPFAVEPWTGGQQDPKGAILVGRPEDFGLDSPFDPPTPTTREQHAIRTTGDGVLVLGVEAAGVELAVWELARALGYRWYLPTPNWEVVPRVDEVPRLDVADPGPQLAARRIIGPVSGRAGRDFVAWATRNGFMGGLQVKALQGQWGRVAEGLRGWVDANPGAISRSSRPSAHGGATAQVKWCPSYRDRDGHTLADLVAREWVAPRLEWPPGRHDNTVARDELPLHQGDSTFWAGCDDGSTPADRAVALANGVAERLGPKLDRKIGVMAYREAFPGPRRERVHPELFVWLMGRGYLGVLWDDAVARWRQAGARHLGWYGYWNLGPRRLPIDAIEFLAVRPSARQLAALADDGFEAVWIEQDGAYAIGGWWKWLLMDVARDPSGWGPRTGRGAKGGRDAGPDPADRRIDDLVEHAFPAGARPAMRRFLLRFDGSDQRILLSPEWVGGAYADLRTALSASRHDPAAVRRIEDLLVGVRWIELELRPGGAGDAKQALVACARDRMMLDDRVSAAAPAPACPFDDWLRDAPDPPAVRWWSGEEGGYARATRFPGAPASGRYEDPLQGLPRDAELWKVWLDPAEGLVIREACHGVYDHAGADPERTHVTSRLLGTSRFVLLDPAGREACVAALPPDRRARDLVFSAGAAESSPVAATDTRCQDQPRELPLDTGLPAEPAVGCDGSTFVGEGLYTLRSANHRTGLDYRELVGVGGAADATTQPGAGPPAGAQPDPSPGRRRGGERFSGAPAGPARPEGAGGADRAALAAEPSSGASAEPSPTGSGRIWVSRWDSPFGPYEDRRPESGLTWRYFYVPLGQQVVTIYNPGQPCTLRRGADPAHDVALSRGGPGYRRVETLGQDGQIWELASCRGVWLVDVPPVVAPRPDQLLVPCALVDDPAHADDVERLGIDVGDCR